MSVDEAFGGLPDGSVQGVSWREGGKSYCRTEKNFVKEEVYW